MYRLSCIVCGGEFHAKRRNALYDTDACKLKAYRARLKQQKLSEEMMLPLELFTVFDCLPETAQSKLMGVWEKNGKSVAVVLLEILAEVGNV